MLINVLRLDESIPLPVYKTAGAAGADICAYIKDTVTIKPGKFAMIPTGLKFDIPEGYEIQVRPRSGLAANYGITVLNTPGTIDADYKGEVKVILFNHGDKPFIIHNRDRIAQLVVNSVIQGDFMLTDKLSTSERGENGFGSTGVIFGE